MTLIKVNNRGQKDNLGRRNLIINGAMRVAQRATSVSGVGGDAGYKTIDRFRLNTSNTAGRLTMSQSTVTDLPGFANALKLDCTTADTSIAATEVGIIQYRFEGQDVQQIKKGTSHRFKNPYKIYNFMFFIGNISKRLDYYFLILISKFKSIK